MTPLMRSMVVQEPGGPEALQPTELPVPQPGPGEARLRVAYSGMNPVDAMLRRARLEWMPVRYPFTPGIEHTGVVDAVGEGVDAALIGARVLSRVSFGGYAEYSLAPAAALLRLPDAMSLAVGAAYRGCSSTAWYALHGAARIKAGDRVLVHSAAGAVGAMAMQIARDAGAEVCGLAGGPAKVAFARELLASTAVGSAAGAAGATGAVLDYLQPDWPVQARAFAGPGGFDIILDGNGGADAAANHGLIGVLGRIVHLGATAGAPAASVPTPQLIAGSYSIGGMTLRAVEAKMGAVADPIILREVLVGRWRVPVSEVVPLAEVAALHARLEARQVMGRALIEVGGG